MAIQVAALKNWNRQPGLPADPKPNGGLTWHIIAYCVNTVTNAVIIFVLDIDTAPGASLAQQRDTIFAACKAESIAEGFGTPTFGIWEAWEGAVIP